MNRTTAGGLLSAFSLGLLTAVLPGSAAQAAPVDVTVVTANGSGCPSATATVQATDDNTFTVTFPAYYAWSGYVAPATYVRKNCQFALQIARPAGKTFAVQGADFSGYSLISEDITGTEVASYYFQGASAAETATGTHTFDGPTSGAWSASDSFADDDLHFAPCGSERNLNINTQVRITSADTGLNWIYLNPSFTVHLTWKDC